MTVAETIRQKLEDSLQPERLDVVDESHLHAGHASAPAGGESHFRVTVVSEAFEGQSRVARQRMIYKVLAEEMAGPIHALAISATAPGEA